VNGPCVVAGRANLQRPSIYPGPSSGLSEPRWPCLAANKTSGNVGGAGSRSLTSSSLLLSVFTSMLKSVGRCGAGGAGFSSLRGVIRKVDSRNI
jgi:hypothetical protein